MEIMKQERKKSKKFQGVYYRISTERKHLGKPDKAIWITWTQNGKKQWENVGNASAGVTEEYAYQRRIEILNKINARETPDIRNRRKAVTLESTMQFYLTWRTEEGKDTYSEWSRHNKHVKPFFGDMPIQHITPEILDRFKAKMLLACPAPSSTKKLFETLRAAINFAIKRGFYTGKNPISTQTSTFTLPRENNKGERFLTPMEVRALLGELALRSQQLHDMAFVSLHTGMRSTEIFGMRSADIDENNKVANIFAKGGARETVLLSDEVLSILLKYRTTPDALLFQKRGGGRLGQISTAFSRAVDALKLNNGNDARYKVWFHTLRHTFASWLAQSGEVGLHELMKHLRHKNIEMTLRYAHLIPDKQREHLAIVSKRRDEPNP